MKTAEETGTVNAAELAEALELESGRPGHAAQLVRLGELRTQLLSGDADHDIASVPGRAGATSPALLPHLSEDASTRKD